MNILIVKDRITRKELETLAKEIYVEMVKAVVDVDQEIMAVGGELHADGEDALLKQGSLQKDLWGFNIYFRETLADSLEYTSLINVRPKHGNASLLIKSPALQHKMFQVVEKRVDWS